MKPLILLPLIACFAGFAQQAKQADPRPVTVQEFDGGPMVTKTASGVINEGSALKRVFLDVNNPACPVQLSRMGVVPRFVPGGDFIFRLVGSASARESISAVEITVVLFDLWGARIQNLSSVTITEVSGGNDVPRTRDSEWGADYVDVRQFMTSIAYVRQVRTSDGRIWKADTRAILDGLASGGLKISAEDLESFTTWPIDQEAKPSGSAHN